MGFTFGGVVRVFRTLVRELVMAVRKELKGRKRTTDVQVRDAGDEGGDDDGEGAEATLANAPGKKKKSTQADIEDDASTNKQKSKKREGGTYDDDDEEDDDDRRNDAEGAGKAKKNEEASSDSEDEVDGEAAAPAADDDDGSNTKAPRGTRLKGAALENLEAEMAEVVARFHECITAIRFDEKQSTIQVVLRVRARRFLREHKSR